jgi:hypothetical protein
VEQQAVHAKRQQHEIESTKAEPLPQASAAAAGETVSGELASHLCDVPGQQTCEGK